MEGRSLDFGDSSGLAISTAQNPQSDGASLGFAGDEISQSTTPGYRLSDPQLTFI